MAAFTTLAVNRSVGDVETGTFTSPTQLKSAPMAHSAEHEVCTQSWKAA
jgi:hypothetical protein